MNKKLGAVVFGLLLSWPFVSFGSGSYSHKLSRASNAISTAKYHRGKQIFTGQARDDNGSSTPATQHQETMCALEVLILLTAPPTP